MSEGGNNETGDFAGKRDGKRVSPSNGSSSAPTQASLSARTCTEDYTPDRRALERGKRREKQSMMLEEPLLRKRVHRTEEEDSLFSERMAHS